MGNRFHVGTRKGLFELARNDRGWKITDVSFLGDPVSAVLADGDGSVWAALDLGDFGAKLWRRDREAHGAKWQFQRFHKARGRCGRSASLVARQDLGSGERGRCRSPMRRHDARRPVPLR
jgi:hypothetical protein